MQKKNNREIRMADVQAAENTEKLIVEGRAITFESPTVLYEFDGVQYKEIIDRTALDNADLTDVPFKYNHSSQIMVMARTRNKTLEFTLDSTGLWIRAELADTSAGRDMYELIKRGDVDKMSFAFTVLESSYNKETHTRRISKIKRIWDVSAVDTPAYQDTFISARSFFEAEAERERITAEAVNRAAQLQVRLKLMKMRGM